MILSISIQFCSNAPYLMMVMMISGESLVQGGSIGALWLDPINHYRQGAFDAPPATASICSCVIYSQLSTSRINLTKV